jgi:hypothetical protein
MSAQFQQQAQQEETLFNKKVSPHFVSDIRVYVPPFGASATQHRTQPVTASLQHFAIQLYTPL